MSRPVARPARGGTRSFHGGGARFGGDGYHGGGFHGGGFHGGGFRGGGGFHGGGFRGGGGGFRGGGRRSDLRLKHDILLIGRLDNGLGFYRFTYNGEERPHVGVIAQEVEKVVPDAVARGKDGYLRVSYKRLGLKFQTYDQWVASGARLPVTVPNKH